MQPITDVEEQQIDDIYEKTKEAEYITKDNYKVFGRGILLYGDVDLNSEKDKKYLLRFNEDICSQEVNGPNWIYSNVDMETGIATATDRVFLKYQTWDIFKWFTYNLMLLGYPKKIIIYSIPVNVLRSNGLNWDKHTKIHSKSNRRN